MSPCRKWKVPPHNKKYTLTPNPTTTQTPELTVFSVSSKSSHSSIFANSTTISFDNEKWQILQLGTYRCISKPTQTHTPFHISNLRQELALVRQLNIHFLYNLKYLNDGQLVMRQDESPPPSIPNYFRYIK